MAGYLLIGDPGAAHFKFIGTIAGEDQVGMRIHEAGSHYSSSGVDDLRVAVEKRFDVAARADCFDSAVAEQHGSVMNDRELAHFRPTRGRSSPASVTSCEQFTSATKVNQYLRVNTR